MPNDKGPKKEKASFMAQAGSVLTFIHSFSTNQLHNQAVAVHTAL